ncbi:MAG: class I SAM-dependent methyltransferase [Thermoplasmata archaeon]|nr:class I SAM-dependent methyltransferase [Thermoplasmata archaeon]
MPKDDVVKFLGLKGTDSLLDLGAGIGYFSIPASKHAGIVVAIDMEPKMLEVLADRIAEDRIANIDLARGDIGALPVADGSFDHIFAAFVYHEVPSAAVFVRECARTLRLGGHLTVVEFQKRETPIGPPVEERKTPRDVLRATAKKFKETSRIETDVYYALKLRKR